MKGGTAAVLAIVATVSIIAVCFLIWQDKPVESILTFLSTIAMNIFTLVKVDRTQKTTEDVQATTEQLQHQTNGLVAEVVESRVKAAAENGGNANASG